MRMNMMMMVIREVSNRLSCNNYSHGGKQSSCCSSNNDDNNNNNNSRFLKYYYLMIIRLSPFLVVWSLVVITSILGLFILYCSPSANSLGLSWVSSSSSELTKRGVNQNQTNDHAAPAANPQQYAENDSKTCDLFNGYWAPDSNAPPYTPSTCPTIPDSKNCFKNGRIDEGFLRWRWQPHDCLLPRFDPTVFLKLVAGKKMAFVGDSVARNQFESLLCLLSQAETPTDVYKDSEDRFRTWLFPSSNFTLMIFWSKFLVKYEERAAQGKGSGAYNLHLDKLDDQWASRIKGGGGVDYAILSDAHWFFRKNYLYRHGQLIGCVYCSEPNVTDLGLNYSLRMGFRAALKYINDCKDCRAELLTVVRTFSPAHFEGGAWDTGGRCNRTGPYDEGHPKVRGSEVDLRALQMEELERAREEGRGRGKKRFLALDVTKAMLMRPDGHPGAFWGNKWMKGYNDCVHWCLPGPIDTWNEFLMAVLPK